MQGSGLADLIFVSGSEMVFFLFNSSVNKFFEVDFAIKVNASNERRFDRSTVIFKFGFRIKLHV